MSLSKEDIQSLAVKAGLGREVHGLGYESHYAELPQVLKFASLLQEEWADRAMLQMNIHHGLDPIFAKVTP